MGDFHTVMKYLKMIGHKMTGSGYNNIILEAGLANH